MKKSLIFSSLEFGVGSWENDLSNFAMEVLE